MALTIADVEDLIMETIEDLELFGLIISSGRKGIPAVLKYPAALVCFVRATNVGVSSSLVLREEYQIMLINKNLSSEKGAARSAYSQIDAVRDALHGATWDYDELDQMNFEDVEIVAYESGEIAYAITVSVVHKLGVVS